MSPTPPPSPPRPSGAPARSRRPRPFRRRGALDRHSLHFGPNMTPMVDVVMVILVFFMASAAFLGPEWYLRSLIPQPPQPPARAALPPGAGPPPQAPSPALALPPVQLSITLARGPDGRVRATGLSLTDAPLPAMLDAIARFAEGVSKDQLEVVIRPAPDVPYAELVALHEGCERLGVTRVGVAVGSP